MLERAHVGAGVAGFELAHPFLDDLDRIGNAIGHRRVRADPAVLHIRLAANRARARGGGSRAEPGLGGLDDLVERIAFVGIGFAAGVDDVHHLFELEHPIGKFEVVRIQHDRISAEMRGVFVVRIDDHDAQIGAFAQARLQQHGNRRRLADAGRTDHREMPGDQFPDVYGRRYRFVLSEPADFHARGPHVWSRSPAGRRRGCDARSSRASGKE